MDSFRLLSTSTYMSQYLNQILKEDIVSNTCTEHAHIIICIHYPYSNHLYCMVTCVIDQAR